MPQPHELPPSDDPLTNKTQDYQGDSLYHRTNDGLVTHTLKGERKIVESFTTPPPFFLYIWACFPLLLLATANLKAAIIAIIATALNFFLIHRDISTNARYVVVGIITLTVVLLYGEGMI